MPAVDHLSSPTTLEQEVRQKVAGNKSDQYHFSESSTKVPRYQQVPREEGVQL
jgi:hypothetical protein